MRDMAFQVNLRQVTFLIFLCCLVVGIAPAFAQHFKFEDGALEEDSSLPYLSGAGNNSIVRNRKVNLTNRVAFGGGFVHQSTELFYKPISHSYVLSYFPSNSNALRIDFMNYSTDLSEFSKSLKEFKDVTFNPSKTHRKKSDVFISYSHQPSYGKLSLTKGVVYNLIYDFNFGLGVVNYSDGGKFPALSLGIGQNLFFSNHVFLRFNLGFKIYNGPDLTSVNLGEESDVSIPKSKDYKKTLHLDSFLNSSLIITL